MCVQRSISDKIFTRQDIFLYSRIILHLRISSLLRIKAVKNFPFNAHSSSHKFFSTMLLATSTRGTLIADSRTSLIRSERDRSSGWYSPEIAIKCVCGAEERKRKREKKFVESRDRKREFGN